MRGHSVTSTLAFTEIPPVVQTALEAYRAFLRALAPKEVRLLHMRINEDYTLEMCALELSSTRDEMRELDRKVSSALAQYCKTPSGSLLMVDKDAMKQSAQTLSEEANLAERFS